MAKPTLEHPPSDRYRAPTGGEAGGPPSRASTDAAAGEAAPGRAGLSAFLAAALGTGVLVVVGGILETTTGLVFVAGAMGAAIGLLYAGSARPRASIRRRSVLGAIAAVAVGAVAIWLIALQQGGALGLFDFLWATTGLLVPVELAAAALGAAWGAGAGPIRG